MAITRTRAPASPSSAARSIRCSGSCAVDGATSTTGPSPGGGATCSPGGSHISGPTTRSHGSQRRGYSSCGSVPISVSARESPLWRPGSGGSPSRARQSLYSRRPCSSPFATTPSKRRHSQAPAGVRGSRAPSEYGGKPGADHGCTCGTSVATGTPHSSAASAGAGVRMSETAMSGANASTDGTVARAAWTAAWYGLSGRSRVGKTWYSGAAANSIPALPHRLLPAPPRLQRDGVAARDERLAEREHRERVAGVAERAEVDAQPLRS